jgi:hypothetical protein
MRSSLWKTFTVAAIVATFSLGTVAPGHAESTAHAADTQACTKAKAKVKKAKKKVKKTKSVGGKKLKKANKKLKKAKKAKRQACGTSGGGGDIPKDGGGDTLEGAFYEGTTSQGENFSFTVTGGAADTRSLFLRGTCFDSRSLATFLKLNWAGTQPLPIGADGRFAGEGTDEDTTDSIRYTISGQITGDRAQGKFGLVWEELRFGTYPYYESWQVFCNGEVSWTAQRQ